MSETADGDRPWREIRAVADEETVTVYQAYGPAIADAALAAGRFVPPFRRGRMTWIKPSFLWMMYRCGWATKPGQERVLAVSMRRDGFEWALGHAALSHFEADVHGTYEAWERQVRESPVRVQWDPERSLRLAPLPHRSLQVGLGGEAARRYADDWVVRLSDVTALAEEVARMVADGDLAAAAALLPTEIPYPVPEHVAARLGMTRSATQPGQLLPRRATDVLVLVPGGVP